MAKKKKKKISSATLPLSLIVLLGVLNFYEDITTLFMSTKEYKEVVNYDIKDIPKFDKNEYIILNENKPYFKEEDFPSEPFEKYSSLDKLGRCGVAVANIGKELMPTEKRGSIGMIKPSGWHTVKYDFVDGKYLYNRCHLIGYQLTGENANELNLITCTRNMNAKVMLKFENDVAEYIKDTGNHVLYRVTPIYDEDNLLAKGVEMEALSLEDNGEGVSFNVFIYNVEEGVEIDYKTGESRMEQQRE